ncbi:hypothetical protein HEB29_000243 [Streptomyces fulvorobeus]|uniref:Uncharacterized protein n=1 Tax=Streptomyces fulvorobeus TaxID=284028 RepID=A0A7Y9H7B7_9ACTN|nr:hypothetical protein [Streptomyces fulvorobeus]
MWPMGEVGGAELLHSDLDTQREAGLPGTGVR